MCELKNWPGLRISVALFAITILSVSLNHVEAQNVFQSGSTGADGALEFSRIPEQRTGHVMVYDSARQRIVMFGGTDSTATWEWQNQRWTEVATQNRPAARRNHGMAYDSVRQRTVLFGGESTTSGQLLNDTWEYDGANWTQVNTATSPSIRQGHSMVFDAARQRILLTGGNSMASSAMTATGLDETWNYDGANWTQLAPATGIGQRFGHKMAYDSVNNTVLNFGGATAAGSAPTPSNATLVWDGTNWVVQSPTTSPVAGNAMILDYDSTQSQFVLFGPNSVTETWTFNGTDWTQQSPVNSPFTRTASAGAFDATAQTLVLFGGDITSTTNFPINGLSPRNESDTWEYDGTNWSAPVFAQPEPVIDLATKPDGIFHYTTISVPANVAVSFKQNAANTPVVWLATGLVQIDGILDLNGEQGGTNPNPGNEALGGPGGFAGGLGGIRQDTSGSFASTAGQGPGGADARINSNENGLHASHRDTNSTSGSAYGNPLLQPLIGGSGGGGSASRTDTNGVNGGGGGGAIAIVSSVQINVTGSILANAGVGGTLFAGTGSGGAIRLVAETVQVTGTLSATGLNSSTGVGRIRIEAIKSNIAGSITPQSAYGPPVFTDFTQSPAISVTGISGQSVSQPPGGSTASTDVVLSQAGTITIDIQTTNIPQGTTLTVRVTGRANVVTATTTPISATGTATATVTLPAGRGTIQVFGNFQSP